MNARRRQRHFLRGVTPGACKASRCARWRPLALPRGTALPTYHLPPMPFALYDWTRSMTGWWRFWRARARITAYLPPP